MVSIVYEASELIGVDDKRIMAGVSASYSFNQHWVIDVDSSKTEQESEDQIITGFGLNYIF